MKDNEREARVGSSIITSDIAHEALEKALGVKIKRVEQDNKPLTDDDLKNDGWGGGICGKWTKCSHSVDELIGKDIVMRLYMRARATEQNLRKQAKLDRLIAELRDSKTNKGLIKGIR